MQDRIIISNVQQVDCCKGSDSSRVLVVEGSKPLSDILDEATSVVECRECSWYKACVMPMRVSPEELKTQIEQAMPGTPLDSLLLNTAAMAQSTLLETCPIFMKRLKADAKLSEQLKNMMREWGSK